VGSNTLIKRRERLYTNLKAIPILLDHPEPVAILPLLNRAELHIDLKIPPRRDKPDMLILQRETTMGWLD
jgi:hypothetical protein